MNNTRRLLLWMKSLMGQYFIVKKLKELKRLNAISIYNYTEAYLKQWGPIQIMALGKFLNFWEYSKIGKWTID